jgi:hypothetical protein
LDKSLLLALTWSWKYNLQIFIANRVTWWVCEKTDQKVGQPSFFSHNHCITFTLGKSSPGLRPFSINCPKKTIDQWAKIRLIWSPWWQALRGSDSVLEICVLHSWKMVGSMKNEKWKMKNEKWKMKNEKWKMKNEKWKMKNGRIQQSRKIRVETQLYVVEVSYAFYSNLSFITSVHILKKYSWRYSLKKFCHRCITLFKSQWYGIQLELSVKIAWAYFFMLFWNFRMTKNGRMGLFIFSLCRSLCYTNYV